MIWSIDVELAQALGDEIEERAHARGKMSPAQIERLNRRFDRSMVGQQTQEPARLEILCNAQQRQQANALPLQRRRSDGLDAVAAQVSSGLDLMLPRPADEAPAIGPSAIVDVEAVVLDEIFRNPRRAAKCQIDRRRADDPLGFAEPPLDQAGIKRRAGVNCISP